jgi:hypothetical protein
VLRDAMRLSTANPLVMSVIPIVGSHQQRSVGAVCWLSRRACIVPLTPSDRAAPCTSLWMSPRFPPNLSP